MAIERIHGFIEIILIKDFVLLIEPAGGRQQAAARRFRQRQLGAGKEKAREDHRLEQGAMAGQRQAVENFAAQPALQRPQRGYSGFSVELFTGSGRPDMAVSGS
jgi:hypothetical protein